MATYSSNTTIKYDSAVSSQISTVSGSTTYTVPSGKYAKLQASALTAGSSANLSVGGSLYANISSSDLKPTDLGFLGEGTSVVISGTSVTLRIVGVLFSNTP